MNKKTVAVTDEQYREIIETIRDGYMNYKPNPRVAFALILESNLLIRVSDITNLRLCDIIKDGDRYRLDIVEQKTQKKRTFTVPKELYNYIKQYCIDNEIKSTDKIVDVLPRQVQKVLKNCCDYLEIENVSTHSFRKYGSTKIYINSGYNIELVRNLLQHSSSAVTARYVCISSKDMEDALTNNLNLI